MGKGSVSHSHPGQHVGNKGKLKIQTLGEVRIRNRIVHADAQNPGVQALVEIEFSVMRLHLPRSDRGEGGGKECHDQMVFSVIIAVVIHQFAFG